MKPWGASTALQLREIIRLEKLMGETKAMIMFCRKYQQQPGKNI